MEGGGPAAVFVVGVATGALGATVGGGSMLSVPFLIFLGLPPAIAIATDRFAGLGAGLSGLYRYWVGGKITWQYVPLLAAASLVGSLVGAQALISSSDAEHLRTGVGVLLVLLVPLLFVGRNLGVSASATSTLRRSVGLCLYFAIQALAGFFGPGTGVLVFYVLMAFFGITITQVAGTQMVPFLVLTLSSLALFANANLVDYRIGLILMAGTAVGAYLGAHFAIERGDRWVRRLFAVIVVISAIRLLY